MARVLILLSLAAALCAPPVPTTPSQRNSV